MLFGALFIALFAVVAIAAPASVTPTSPTDDIAVVEDAPDGTITQDELDGALQQTASAQGLKEVPPTDDPQYQQLRDAAISDLILSRWVLGEAEERGIEVSEREIDTELDTVIKEQFGSEKAFEKFLEDSGFTEDEARDRIQLQLISDRIQNRSFPARPTSRRTRRSSPPTSGSPTRTSRPTTRRTSTSSRRPRRATSA